MWTLPKATGSAWCCSLCTAGWAPVLPIAPRESPLPRVTQGQSRAGGPGWFQWAVHEGGCGGQCVVPVTVCDVLQPGSGSPLTGGSSCLPAMTRLSNCGTKPAGSVSTHTASMAGESADLPSTCSAPTHGPGCAQAQGPSVGAVLLPVWVEGSASPSPPHITGALDLKACLFWGLPFPFTF